MTHLTRISLVKLIEASLITVSSECGRHSSLTIHAHHGALFSSCCCCSSQQVPCASSAERLNMDVTICWFITSSYSHQITHLIRILQSSLCLSVSLCLSQLLPPSQTSEPRTPWRGPRRAG
ncbi:hypothetical protein E2C01_011311 [Portunus trituberculatus]|uniref:Secreted protein n=1 Tax=Portunus trituberculatus TaxID=210409 RepID=A0A5B7DAY7_PORTR|nr:hypothetical protein [Portunus trituberculatus]